MKEQAFTERAVPPSGSSADAYMLVQAEEIYANTPLAKWMRRSYSEA